MPITHIIVMHDIQGRARIHDVSIRYTLKERQPFHSAQALKRNLFSFEG